ncbi:alpha/beta hydrolase [Frigoriflavimonas asaccharolytica]|uniref:Acetyl esterase/lipase n=1 Tax=Frigoriflavimonas asaccharolytica TaxID=2735899 RepID=A0A8J8K8Z9_9FLAO|nr:alpha/beta hydrolase [Frigoriflavimonas asaccharolytica]NRS92507.1 acetyl esterase/lipase [Frigoriflavimonas asaccharolytica]
MKSTILTIFAMLLFTSCASTKNADIVYGTSAQNEDLKLNIFVPKNSKNKKLQVLIYVYGGNWNSGKRSIYNFFGRNFARKDVVTVIPEYTLSPKADVNQMTAEIATAIKWVQNNIKDYHGNAENLFITGHSAGGQLGANAVLNPKFGINPKDISGIILNDAAGIDMKDYLEKYPPTEQDNYLATWSNDPEKWCQASPINFLDENSPPFMIYVGKKTYPSIITANEHFVTKLNEFQPEIQPIFINKKHVPMILQYALPWNKRSTEILEFMNKNLK